MSSYEVEVAVTMYTTVTVEADSEEAALAKVERDFPLPPRDEWHEGTWEYEVLTPDEEPGEETGS